MSGTLATLALAALAAALLAWLLRRLLSPGEDVIRMPGAGAAADHRATLREPAEPDPARESDVVALTSDGWAFLPVGEVIHLVPPEEPAGLRPTGSTPYDPVRPTRAAPARPPERLQRGALLGARVRRGAPDHDPWRLEALGPDGELRAWRFETREAAQAALGLLVARIVRAPIGPDGESQAPSEADYATALRRDEEIEAELAWTPEEADEPDDWR